MKTYMKEQRIDHLKYLDYEEHWLEEKIANFNHLSKNYDNFLRIRRDFEEELDCIRTKFEVCQKREILDEFVIIAGVCPLETKPILERLLFRKSRGHSIVSFRSREADPKTCIFLCLMNKNVYKHIGDKVLKACQSNEVRLYDLPNLPNHLMEYELVVQKKLR